MPRNALMVAVTVLTLGAVGVAAATTADDARRAAQVFGDALMRSKASSLRPILPARGKVRVVLSRMGPEEGLFGAGQVEALFRDFLREGSIRSFDVAGVESDGVTSALVHGVAVATDREGRPGRLGIHLSFQAEEGRWVLREIKETPE